MWEGRDLGEGPCGELSAFSFIYRDIRAAPACAQNMGKTGPVRVCMGQDRETARAQGVGRVAECMSAWGGQTCPKTGWEGGSLEGFTHWASLGPARVAQVCLTGFREGAPSGSEVRV